MTDSPLGQSVARRSIGLHRNISFGRPLVKYSRSVRVLSVCSLVVFVKNKAGKIVDAPGAGPIRLQMPGSS